MSACGDLEAMYRAGIRAVAGRPAVREWLRAHPLSGQWHLIAVGKAAAAMTLGARDVLGERLLGGLVITREGYEDPALDGVPGLRMISSAHPVPDARSLAAGDAAVTLLEEAPADARFLVLISGGASALMERLPGGAGEAELAALNRRMLAGGLAIGDMNRIRRRFSTVKGGRLGVRLAGRTACQLIISDVPGDDPAVIGSGPFVAAPASDAGALPEGYDELMPVADPSPTPDDPGLGGLDTHLVATNRHAVEAAAAEARRLGYAVHDHADDPLEGDAVALGHRIGAGLRDAPPGVHLRGGEPTVVLPENPGRGGRMQALALAAACELAGSAGTGLLAGGTDGADGASEAAGALVDGGTLRRGAAYGADAETALRRADAGGFLSCSGDLIETGPTGTNVMDLVIGLREAE
ncbi:D-glycerate 2-kinase [wastewater metagenome]|uniref:D-glycerate 2-kinase n=2 Tax=unclassified sequences TaxID=12908 RepID=A0A5B8RCV5_9ZZZZ|nr:MULTISPECIES: DUF4147 domain-containing protein [Arhodomonas]MCS4504428.1 DUF4147 domain-containing protein [Arhodomonas aquaeolei]QEA04537.1 D-glycerate 2-kinase [uncultured organism]